MEKRAIKKAYITQVIIKKNQNNIMKKIKGT